MGQMIDPLYALSGFGVGVLVGLTGVGGGSLMTPLLILLFGVHPATAVGTDLLFAACTKTIGAAINAQRQTIDWTVTGRLAVGSIPATALTVTVLHFLRAQTDIAARLISPVVAVAILGTALMLVFHRQAHRFLAPRVAALSAGYLTGATVATGTILGVLVSLSSIGAGALGVTALTLLYPRLSLTKVIGSDIAHAIPLTLLGGMGYWFLGAVNWPLLGSLLSGSVPGIILSSLLVTRVPTQVLRLVLATVLAIAAVKLVV